MCCFWLEFNIVLQSATCLDAVRTLLCIGATRFGADGLRTTVKLPAATLPRVLSGGFCLEVYAAKASEERPWRQNLRKP